MIEITWGQLRHGDYMQSLAKLFAAPMGFEHAQKFVLMGREIKKQQTLADETHKKILEKVGTPDLEKKGFFTIPEEAREEYAKEMEKFAGHKFTLRINKFEAEALAEAIKFSPQDLILLENILVPFELGAEEVKEHAEAQTEATAH